VRRALETNLTWCSLTGGLGPGIWSIAGVVEGTDGACALVSIESDNLTWSNRRTPIVGVWDGLLP